MRVGIKTPRQFSSLAILAPGSEIGPKHVAQNLRIVLQLCIVSQNTSSSFKVSTHELKAANDLPRQAIGWLIHNKKEGAIK
jgi:hypothetical protein